LSQPLNQTLIGRCYTINDTKHIVLISLWHYL